MRHSEEARTREVSMISERMTRHTETGGHGNASDILT